MKTNNIFFMVIFLSFISVAVNGQSHKAIPEWYLSKGVQRINNSAYLERISKSQLTVKSLDYPNWVISKAAARINNSNEEVQASGNLVSKGYPYWTISKGIGHIKQ